jgi:23S rRNA (cytosine1962-C5)-methyltransferase
VVIDIYSRGMRDRMPLIEGFFAEKLPGMRCVVRLGADAARREGIEQIESATHDITFCEQSVRFGFTIGAGQKTGFYLDQRDNRRLIAQWARGRRVLDLFCYHGAFSLSALANGAEDATAVDSSEKAIAVALNNAEINGMELETICSDVFDVLPKLSDEGKSYDMIICDPPKLAPGKKDYRKALKAYRYLIDRCLRLLEPNGLLLVASCSNAVGLEDMRQLLQQQSKGNAIELDVVASTNQPADHPWPVAFTTGRYLSAIMVERRA